MIIFLIYAVRSTYNQCFYSEGALEPQTSVSGTSETVYHVTGRAQNVKQGGCSCHMSPNGPYAMSNECVKKPQILNYIPAQTQLTPNSQNKDCDLFCSRDHDSIDINTNVQMVHQNLVENTRTNHPTLLVNKQSGNICPKKPEHEFSVRTTNPLESLPWDNTNIYTDHTPTITNQYGENSIYKNASKQLTGTRNTSLPSLSSVSTETHLYSRCTDIQNTQIATQSNSLNQNYQTLVLQASASSRSTPSGTQEFVLPEQIAVHSTEIRENTNICTKLHNLHQNPSKIPDIEVSINECTKDTNFRNDERKKDRGNGNSVLYSESSEKNHGDNILNQENQEIMISKCIHESQFNQGQTKIPNSYNSSDNSHSVSGTIAEKKYWLRSASEVYENMFDDPELKNSQKIEMDIDVEPRKVALKTVSSKNIGQSKPEFIKAKLDRIKILKKTKSKSNISVLKRLKYASLGLKPTMKTIRSKAPHKSDNKPTANRSSIISSEKTNENHVHFNVKLSEHELNRNNSQIELNTCFQQNKVAWDEKIQSRFVFMNYDANTIQNINLFASKTKNIEKNKLARTWLISQGKYTDFTSENHFSEISMAENAIKVTIDHMTSSVSLMTSKNLNRCAVENISQQSSASSSHEITSQDPATSSFTCSQNANTEKIQPKDQKSSFTSMSPMVVEDSTASIEQDTTKTISNHDNSNLIFRLELTDIIKHIQIMILEVFELQISESDVLKSIKNLMDPETIDKLPILMRIDLLETFRFFINISCCCKIFGKDYHIHENKHGLSNNQIFTKMISLGSTDFNEHEHILTCNSQEIQCEKTFNNINHILNSMKFMYSKLKSSEIHISNFVLSDFTKNTKKSQNKRYFFYSAAKIYLNKFICANYQYKCDIKTLEISDPKGNMLNLPNFSENINHCRDIFICSFRVFLKQISSLANKMHPHHLFLHIFRFSNFFYEILHKKFDSERIIERDLICRKFPCKLSYFLCSQLLCFYDRGDSKHYKCFLEAYCADQRESFLRRMIIHDVLDSLNIKSVTKSSTEIIELLNGITMTKLEFIQIFTLLYCNSDFRKDSHKFRVGFFETTQYTMISRDMRRIFYELTKLY